MGRAGGLQLVRHEDLIRRWNIVGSGPGTLRHFVQYVGGPEPHPHGNRETGIESDKGSVGLHMLPVGNRMPEHTHPRLDEVYVVIRGQMAVASGDREVLAGPLDCVHIPAGTPHASRNAGLEDVQFLWFQWGFDAPGGATARVGSGGAPARAPGAVRPRAASAGRTRPATRGRGRRAASRPPRKRG